MVLIEGYASENKMAYLLTRVTIGFALFLQVSSYLRVCYYTNWSQYRPKGGKFVPENVDPNLCTHIIFAFAKLDKNKLVPYEWNDDSTAWNTGMYEKVNNLKQKNPKLKVLLAVGGWNAGSLPFSDMVATRDTRTIFRNSTVEFLRSRNFDGLDMDWEYPAMRGGRPEDKNRLTLLLRELRTKFEQEAVQTRRNRLLLTAAVPAGKSNIDNGYDVAAIAGLLDFINVMTYDLHGSWETKTGLNSPLFARSSEQGGEAQLNMNWAANYWVSLGVPREKLIIGIPLYGRSFTLGSTMETDVGAPVTGAGPAGKYTRENGFLSYYEICEEIKNGAQRVWHAEHRCPYIVKGTTWVGYDDPESVKEKITWLKSSGFGGAMVWSLALDDFSGQFCNNGRYPLLTVINRELGDTVTTPTGIKITPSLPTPLSAPLPAVDVLSAQAQPLVPSVSHPAVVVPDLPAIEMPTAAADASMAMSNAQSAILPPDVPPVLPIGESAGLTFAAVNKDFPPVPIAVPVLPTKPSASAPVISTDELREIATSLQSLSVDVPPPPPPPIVVPTVDNLHSNNIANGILSTNPASKGLEQSQDVLNALSSGPIPMKPVSTSSTSTNTVTAPEDKTAPGTSGISLNMDTSSVKSETTSNSTKKDTVITKTTTITRTETSADPPRTAPVGPRIISLFDRNINMLPVMRLGQTRAAGTTAQSQTRPVESPRQTVPGSPRAVSPTASEPRAAEEQRLPSIPADSRITVQQLLDALTQRNIFRSQQQSRRTTEAARNQIFPARRVSLLASRLNSGLPSNIITRSNAGTPIGAIRQRIAPLRVDPQRTRIATTRRRMTALRNANNRIGVPVTSMLLDNRINTVPVQRPSSLIADVRATAAAVRPTQAGRTLTPALTRALSTNLNLNDNVRVVPLTAGRLGQGQGRVSLLTFG